MLVPWEYPEGPLEVLGIRTYRGPSGDIPGTPCASWVASPYSSYKSQKILFFKLTRFKMFFCAWVYNNYFHPSSRNWCHFCRLQETSTGHISFRQVVMEHTLPAECASLSKEIATMLAKRIKARQRKTHSKTKKVLPVRGKTPLGRREKMAILQRYALKCKRKNRHNLVCWKCARQFIFSIQILMTYSHQLNKWRWNIVSYLTYLLIYSVIRNLQKCWVEFSNTKRTKNM